MIKEYYKFLREYFNLTRLKKKFLIITIITAVLYKGFSLTLPIFASWIVKYVTNNNIFIAKNSKGYGLINMDII